MAWEWNRLLPPTEPRPEAPREQIWSIPASDRQTYFRLVPALWLVALSAIGYNALVEPDASGFRGWFDAARSAASDFLEMGTALAMLAMLLTRPLNMIGGAVMTLYQAMANRWVIPVIEKHRDEGRREGLAAGREEGLATGREEGLATGREEGLAESQGRWLAWNARRLEAERDGRHFDEPHPEPEAAVPEQ